MNNDNNEKKEVMMACSKGSFITSIIFLVLSVLATFFTIYFAAIITQTQEVDNAAEGIAFVFVFIILIIPVLGAAILSAIFDIINIIIYARMLKTEKKTYGKVGLIISIVFLVTVILTIVLMFAKIESGNIVEVVTTTAENVTS